MPHDSAVLHEVQAEVAAPLPPAPRAFSPARSAWTMPSFYLVPLVCAALFLAMGVVRLAMAARHASQPRD